LLIRILLIATTGHVCRLDHWPSGTVLGTTASEEFDAGPLPRALVATTVKVYVVPSVKPVIVVVVEGGDPVTTVGVCAVPPIQGVTE
jgi:hypothetical protein